MRMRLAILVVALWCVAPLVASAEPLTVGDDAPAIAVSKWVKGEPVDRFESKNVYVVEFWATWCGPCRTSIPHLTELQKRFKDRGVTILGVSVWEEDQDKVEPFVKDMGDKMDYRVATDDVPKGEDGNKGKMAVAWMKAAEANGIPTAFIVRDGKVAWIGHPMGMDKALEKAVSGDFDIQVAAREYREEKAREKKLQAAIGKIRQALQSGEQKEALAAVEKVLGDDAALEEMLGTLKFKLLGDTGREDEALTYGGRLVDTVLKGNAGALNNIAWMIVDPDAKGKPSKGHVELALKAAARANELTNGENAGILDTLAKAEFDSGDAAKAVEHQEKAVKLAGGEDQGMKERLERYRKAVDGKGDDKDKDKDKDKNEKDR